MLDLRRALSDARREAALADGIEDDLALRYDLRRVAYASASARYGDLFLYLTEYVLMGDMEAIRTAALTRRDTREDAEALEYGRGGVGVLE